MLATKVNTLSFVSLSDIVDAVSAGIPLRVVVHDVTEPIYRIVKGLSGEELGHRLQLVARVHAREDEFAVRVGIRSVDSFHLFYLGRVEAFAGLRAFAEKSFGLEKALLWNLDDAIFDTVYLVALCKDFVVNEASPSSERNVVGGVCIACDGVEHGSLSLKIVEVDGGASSHDTIVILRVFLRGLDPHSTAQRTADIIVLRRSLTIERLDQLFGRCGACVKTRTVSWCACGGDENTHAL
ncbi:hypothetical protein HG530_013135 [Fusarium avenaceum]|nr:hypothetical protein HG530_013135 [Fusarium avenaceum]